MYFCFWSILASLYQCCYRGTVEINYTFVVMSLFACNMVTLV